MAFSKEQRKQLIGLIVANKSFKEDQLEPLTDNQLVALSDAAKLDLVVNSAKGKSSLKDFNDEMIRNEYKARFEAEDDEEEMDEEEEEMTAKPKKPMAANKWFAEAPAEIRKIVANAKRIEDQTRASLIERITTNGSCPLSAQDLAGRSTEDLELFASMVGQGQSDYGYNYSGAAGVFTANRQTKIEPLGLPTSDSYMN